MTSPPRLAALMLRLLLPAELAEAVAGDLEEEWTAGRHRSRVRYWRLALASVAAHYRGRFRSQPAVRAFEPHAEQGDGPMQSLLQDFVYGVRMMRRSPGFTASALVTLALGIGANTAIFSFVNVLVLEPLPYHDPSRLAFVQSVDVERNQTNFGLSTADFVEFTARARAFDGLAAYSYWSASLTGGDQPERVQAYRVTANTFDLLGVAPLLGRTFSAEEGQPGRGDAVVLSYALWQRRFAGDGSIVGRTVQVDGRPTTVVGVMPRRFEFPIFNFKGDLWAPLPLDRTAVLANRAGAPTWPVIGRLAPGLSYAKAQADVDVLMRQLEAEHPETNRAKAARLVEMGKLDDEVAGGAMLIVLATVGVVLLLACANVANLLLARGVSRQRELAVRAALGAARLRIARQLLAESLVLALGGGVLGAALAWIALGALVATLPEVVLTTQPNLDALGINARTLAFTLLLSIATTIVFGLLPALRASRPGLHDGLKEAAGAGGSSGTRRLRSALVIAEVALSTTLLVAAGLLVRSYQNLTRVTPGFTAEGVMTVAVTLPAYKYPDADAHRRFFEQAVDRIGHAPGVESAALVNVLPFSTYNRGGRFTIDGAAAPAPGREPAMDFRVVTAGYFTTLQIPVTGGRVFDASDGPDGQPVAIVNQTFVRQYFAGGDPIGRRVRLGRADSTAPWKTIVGVVGDVRHEQLTVAVRPELYVPLAQSPTPMMMLAARTAADPASLVPAIRAAIRAIDPAQPIYHVRTLQTMFGESLAPQTSAATMVALFSGLALVLAAVGIYGVVSYAVSQQTREFGVRIALGARGGDLIRLVLRQGVTLVLIGVLLGGAGALAAMRLLGGVLYGVSPSDPLTYALVLSILAVVGLVASGLPAIRAARIPPVVALRAE